MPNPPLKRGSTPRLPIERDEVRATLQSDSPPADPGSEREFLLNVLHQQTTLIVGKIADLRTETDARFLALEKDKLEDDRTRFEVQKMTATVRDLIASDQRQNTSLVALTAALKPSVEATAAVEGAKSGAASGKLSGRIWGLVGSALALVIAGALQQCQVQISRGAFDTKPVSSVSK